MMPRAHSWHVPSPGHRPTGRPDPAEQLAVPVASPEIVRDNPSRSSATEATEAAAAAQRPKPPRPH